MSAGYELDETIERYLNGLMDEDESSEFIQQMNGNIALKEKVDEHRKLLEIFNEIHKKEVLKKRLDAIHNDYFSAKDKRIEPENAPKIIRMYSAVKTFYVAASISFFIMVSGLTLFYFLYMHTNGKTDFKELRRGIEDIRKSQSALIKGINASKKQSSIPATFSGTGFAITSDGFLLTSKHVIRDADSVFIEGNKGIFKAKVIYIDSLYDYAILKVQDSTFKTMGFIPYSFKSKEADLGEKIYTLGYPREEIVFGEGSLSSRSGYQGDSTSYQVSIPVNPGNSGGPVMDENGNLIGMISGKQSTSDGATFAIKSSFLMKSIKELSKSRLGENINLPKSSRLNVGNRVDQLKKIEDFIYIVKVYN